MNDRQTPSFAAATGLADPSLPAGARLGSFELQRPIARSASSVVYLATDHALALTVAIQEYLPARLVQRDSGLRLRATDPWHEDVIARGLRAFIDEARLLAHCDHPALVRISQLFEVNGSAYRVMPFYSGQRLLDVRRTMPEAPDEASLRALLDDLLGALEAIHRGGRAHGGVTPGDILLLGDDRPLLLGPGAAAREIGSDLVDSLMASLETTLVPDPARPMPTGSIGDLVALAEVTRFCITGALPPAAGPGRGRETLADVIARSFEPTVRPRYSAELLSTLDAAMSPVAEDWPLSVAQFRTWLARGAPRATPRATLRRESLFATADAAAPPAVPPAAVPPAAAPLSPEPPPLRPVSEATTIRTHAEPPTDPMTTDRAPWLAPPVRVAVQRKRRGRKLAMAAALAGLAVVVLGFVSGAWEQVPAIALDHLPKLGIERPAEATAPVAPPEPSAKAEVTAPPPEAAPASTSAAPPVIAEAAPAPASVPAPVEQAAPAPPAAAPTPTAPTPTATAPTAATRTATAPTGAAPTAAAPTEPANTSAAVATTAAAAPDTSDARVQKNSPAAARPHRTAALPARAAPPTGSPRAACAAKSEFALYRCMQQQCDSSRWYAHPQCIRLRSSDRVD